MPSDNTVDPASWPASWQALEAELAAWQRLGRRPTFWWRDDDAVEPTPALDRLLALTRHGLPLVLAVIPAHATVGLARHLAPFIDRGAVRVVQHGWAHLNHAPAGEKASEFPSSRALDACLTDLAAGRAVLDRLFGPDRWDRMLVPPWNRIGTPVIDRLVGEGYATLSTFAPRPAAQRNGLALLNAHVDPIDWKRGRVFKGLDKTLRQLTDHLTARRLAMSAPSPLVVNPTLNPATDASLIDARPIDPEEPTGLLTHHLAHPADLWPALEQIMERVNTFKVMECNQ